MQTEHLIHYSDARDLAEVGDGAVHLVVTSPPYPMISMWDETFCQMNPEIGARLEDENGREAFTLMHAELARVWSEVFRVLIPGGFACINIGDATRTIGKDFQLYPNHAQVIQDCSTLGFEILPEIIWRKPTNSPTKFLGSGTLPCGAYVTLEHEKIVIFRKPSKRVFTTDAEREMRWSSSFFWEERNKWFSDIWQLNGIQQTINAKKVRKRSGAYPIEIPLRLISMYSSKFDTVLDPFLGTATTTLAAIARCRNSIGFELDPGFGKLHRQEIPSLEFVEAVNGLTRTRLSDHAEHMNSYLEKHGEVKYSTGHGLPVVSRQEVSMSFEWLNEVRYRKTAKTFRAQYERSSSTWSRSPSSHKRSACSNVPPDFRGFFKPLKTVYRELRPDLWRALTDTLTLFHEERPFGLSNALPDPSSSSRYPDLLKRMLD